MKKTRLLILYGLLKIYERIKIIFQKFCKGYKQFNCIGSKCNTIIQNVDIESQYDTINQTSPPPSYN